MKCLCERLTMVGQDMTTNVYGTPKYNNYYLQETYGTWRLRHKDSIGVEIFYCPLCGRRLNKWEWANERRKEILDSL